MERSIGDRAANGDSCNRIVANSTAEDLSHGKRSEGKPEVPTGPIPMDGKPDPVSTSAIKGAIASLAEVDLQRIQQLIERKDWPQAVNELDAIAAKSKKVQNAAQRMVSRVAKQHWSPLLEMGW
jgi:hypothetical protein